MKGNTKEKTQQEMSIRARKDRDLTRNTQTGIDSKVNKESFSRVNSINSFMFISMNNFITKIRMRTQNV